jgi:hypothetical protein
MNIVIMIGVWLVLRILAGMEIMTTGGGFFEGLSFIAFIVTVVMIVYHFFPEIVLFFS